MGDIISRRHVIDPTLNLEEILSFWLLLKATRKQEIWHTHPENIILSPKRNEVCSLFINGIICEKPL